MHTHAALSGDSFRIVSDGSDVSFDAILPGFSLRDRLGVVVDRDGGGLAAGLTVLAAVTDHYRQLSELESGFFLYPDFYVLHLDRLRGWHAQIDVWPQHKEVVVPPSAEEVLSAVNDRAITRLLVPPGPVSAGSYLRETLARAHRQIVTVLQYGGGPDAPITLTGDRAAADFVDKAAAASAVFMADGGRPGGPDAGVVDRLTPIAVEDLPVRLLGVCAGRSSTGMSADYRQHNGAVGDVLARHLVDVSPVAP